MTRVVENDLVGHNSKLEQKIFSGYNKIITEQKANDSEGVCGQCRKSHPNIKNFNRGLPVSFFVVGENFHQQKFRIMFVGKTVRGGWEEEARHPEVPFIDVRCAGKTEFLPFWSASGFWQCIKQVCQNLWNINDADEIWRRITITNLVKCSISEKEDETPEKMIKNCIQEAGFFKMEVDKIKPTHIIIFTGSPGSQDKFVKNVNALMQYFELKSKQPEGIMLDGKSIFWREYEPMNKKESQLQGLLTNHPVSFWGSVKQEAICQKIVYWINPEQANR